LTCHHSFYKNILIEIVDRRLQRTNSRLLEKTSQ